MNLYLTLWGCDGTTWHLVTVRQAELALLTWQHHPYIFGRFLDDIQVVLW